MAGCQSKQHAMKISLALKSSEKAIEQRKRLHASQRGKKFSSELCMKLSLSHKGQIPWNKGKFGYKIKPCSKERKQKIGLANKGRLSKFKGVPRSEETRKKISLALKNKPKSNEHREKIRQNRKKQVMPNRDSKPEKMLQLALQLQHIEFEKHEPIMGQPDIFIEPNICIFVDGDFFHANPSLYKADDYIIHGRFAKNIWARDVQVTHELTAQGYQVIRIWEHEILENSQLTANRIINLIRKLQKIDFSDVG